ncbi:MAG TPA: hypothetical protein VNZ64_10855 [Candidatus Acidoferrum sp.]|nr:hypothetical protein [Candidatus Acidoferrum sp.]
MKANLLFLVAVAACVSGCHTYQYRIVQPATSPSVVADQPVTVRLDPLEYHLRRVHDRLEVTISNPTDDRLALLGNRSYVVDPRGESHPLRGHVLGPHSFTRMFLPPPPLTYPYPDWAAWGWGWGWGPYNPFWSPYYGSVYWGPPPVAYYQVTTAYDWGWKTGPARLRLTYERNGKTFEHDFEFIREPMK